MPATQFAVVYGTASKIIRRIIEPGQNPDDSHITLAQANLNASESLVALNLADFPNSRTRADVQSKIGVPTSSGRCAIVPGVSAALAVGQTVSSVIIADPVIDNISGSQLIQTDTASIGWTWNGATFVAPVVAPV